MALEKWQMEKQNAYSRVKFTNKFSEALEM